MWPVRECQPIRTPRPLTASLPLAGSRAGRRCARAEITRLGYRGSLRTLAMRAVPARGHRDGHEVSNPTDTALKAVTDQGARDLHSLREPGERARIADTSAGITSCRSPITA